MIGKPSMMLRLECAPRAADVIGAKVEMEDSQDFMQDRTTEPLSSEIRFSERNDKHG